MWLILSENKWNNVTNMLYAHTHIRTNVLRTRTCVLTWKWYVWARPRVRWINTHTHTRGSTHASTNKLTRERTMYASTLARMSSLLVYNGIAVADRRLIPSSECDRTDYRDLINPPSSHCALMSAAPTAEAVSQQSCILPGDAWAVNANNKCSKWRVQTDVTAGFVGHSFFFFFH